MQNLSVSQLTDRRNCLEQRYKFSSGWINTETPIKMSKAIRAYCGLYTKHMGFTVPLIFTGLYSYMLLKQLEPLFVYYYVFYCSAWKLLYHHPSHIIKKERKTTNKENSSKTRNSGGLPSVSDFTY